MKVLLEGWRLAQNRNIGGVGSYWQQLIPALQSHADDETKFTILSAFLSPKKTKSIEAFRKKGAHIRHWWANPNWLQALGRWGIPAAWMGSSHDLIHACEPNWDIKSDAALVVTCHDLMFHHYPQFVAPDCAKRLELGTQKSVARASLWLCNSQHTQSDLIKTFGVAPARTLVTPLGVGEKFFNVSKDEDTTDPYFLFVGSVEPKKNLPMLVEAFGLAKKSGLQAKLKIVGRASWQSNELANLMRQDSSLENHVEFVGFVPHRELPQLIAASRGLVLPSRYEGFGIPVVEAMAAGTPVLCTKRGALESTGGTAAAYFDPDDVEGLANLLVSVDSDPQRRDNMREQGRKHAANFTWQNCAELSLQGYQRALKLHR